MLAMVSVPAAVILMTVRSPVTLQMASSNPNLAPAIQYAEEGFPVSEVIAYYWGRNVAILANQPGGILQTYTVNGKPPEKGQIFRNPDLAHTYHLHAFYDGEIAEKIDQFFRANGE